MACGFQGEEALRYYQKKEDMLQSLYHKTQNYMEEKRDEYQAEHKAINKVEEEMMEEKNRIREREYDI